MLTLEKGNFQIVVTPRVVLWPAVQAAPGNTWKTLKLRSQSI
jgi:hypothetical protein